MHALDLVKHNHDSMRNAVYAVMRCGQYRDTILDLIEQAGSLPRGCGGIRTIPADGEESILLAVWSDGNGGVNVRAASADNACVVVSGGRLNSLLDVADRHGLEIIHLTEGGIEMVMAVSELPMSMKTRIDLRAFGPH